MLALPVHSERVPQAADPLVLTVVIDTEEEFDWAASFDPAQTSVHNIGFQPLAQRIFDKHGVIPTYVVDYPVATTPASINVLREFADAGRCEIGAHLHPWVNPPAEERVNTFHSYASNLPGDLMRRKLEVLTAAIEQGFGRKPLVYKAGRYGVGPGTPEVLAALGYAVDASVVPHTSFAADGGPDFQGLPDSPFLIQPGLVEMPLSVHYAGRLASLGSTLYPALMGGMARRLRLPGILARLGLLERLRLSPEGHTLADMIRQTRMALASGARTLMLTYHSSTLMPGSTPYTRTEQQRDDFLTTLDEYLTFFTALRHARTSTVTEAAAAFQ